MKLLYFLISSLFPPPPQAGYGEAEGIRELMAEKEALDSSFKHAARLLDEGMGMGLEGDGH